MIPSRRSGWSAAFSAALCLLALAPGGRASSLAGPGRDGGADTASEEPAGRVTAVDAEKLRAALASQQGKVVVLNFWATWCEPCREEFPGLVRFAGEHAKQVSLVTVSLDDPSEAGGAVRAFLDGMKTPGLRLIKGPGDPDAFINSVDPAWSGALPATFVHRADGTRAHAVHGTISYPRLREIVTPLLPAR